MMSASCCWKAVKFHFVRGEPITPSATSGKLLVHVYHDLAGVAVLQLRHGPVGYCFADRDGFR